VNETPTQPSDEGVWDRLRRRKVVQWSVAYVAAAWAVLQGLQFLADTYGWPSTALRVVTLAFAVGLPIVVTLAWYHGDRGEQRVGGTELAIVAALFLVGGGVVWYYQRTADTATTTSSAPSIDKAIPTDASIAVLPFVNMSADKEQEYFADGISEELLNLLAQVPELRVIARTSSFSFKGKDVDIAEIARRLNVANVLEGSVRKSGDTLRITAQLVRASDSSHLWSQTYDRQMTDVFKVQDEIATTVVEQLKIKLLGAALEAKATDPKAYALYLQARKVSRQYTPSTFEQAIALYQQAVALDPAYAAAWVGLAETYMHQVGGGLRTTDEGTQLAREATNKALEVDPEYAPAHVMLGMIALFYENDLGMAARYLENAMTLEPSNLDFVGDAAFLLRRLGRLDQAIAFGEFVVARDPVNELAYNDLGNAYRFAGRLDKAIDAYRTALSLNSGSGLLFEHAQIGEVLLQKGDARAALTEIEQIPPEIDEPLRLVALSMAHYAVGQKVESDTALVELIRKHEKTLASQIAYVFAFRGEADRAFEWLDKAVQHRDPALGSIAVYPMFANIHSDPRWLPFLRKHGMAPEQLAAIKFDVKVPN
jgi:TolB-like protein/tetratricopeptide (TPR) repeat protein